MNLLKDSLFYFFMTLMTQVSSGPGCQSTCTSTSQTTASLSCGQHASSLVITCTMYGTSALIWKYLHEFLVGGGGATSVPFHLTNTSNCTLTVPWAYVDNSSIQSVMTCWSPGGWAGMNGANITCLSDNIASCTAKLSFSSSPTDSPSSPANTSSSPGTQPTSSPRSDNRETEPTLTEIVAAGSVSVPLGVAICVGLASILCYMYLRGRRRRGRGSLELPAPTPAPTPTPAPSAPSPAPTPAPTPTPAPSAPSPAPLLSPTPSEQASMEGHFARSGLAMSCGLQLMPSTQATREGQAPQDQAVKANNNIQPFGESKELEVPLPQEASFQPQKASNEEQRTGDQPMQEYDTTRGHGSGNPLNGGTSIQEVSGSEAPSIPSHAPPVVYVPSVGQQSLVVVSVQPGHSAIDNITVGYSHGVLCDLAKLV